MASMHGNSAPEHFIQRSRNAWQIKSISDGTTLGNQTPCSYASRLDKSSQKSTSSNESRIISHMNHNQVQPVRAPRADWEPRTNMAATYCRALTKGKPMSSYEKAAQSIIEGVGGPKNISEVSHCFTRLRFKLVDPSLADDDGLKTARGSWNRAIRRHLSSHRWPVNRQHIQGRHCSA